MSIAPVLIEFLVKGTPQVSAAFKSIQDSAMRAERAQTVASSNAMSTRVGLATKEASAKVNASKGAEKEALRALNSETKAKEKAAREGERIIAREANAKVRLMRQATNEVEKIEERALAKNRRAREQDERDKDRDAKAWVARREREQKAERAANVRFAGAMVSAGARGVYAGAGSVANKAMGLATTAATLGGGFSIADSVQGENHMRQQAAVLSASTILSRAGQPGADPNLGRAMSTDEVLGKAKAVGISQGIDPSEVLGGYDEIKKLSGNLEKATQVMPNVAKLATATGSSLVDTSKLAGNILAANPSISNEDLDKQLRIFTRQGVVGGVEVGDFARYGSRITAGAMKYGGNKEGNEATLGAMAQMSRQYGGAASPAEAALGAQRFGDDVVKHAADLKASGIEVSDGKGNLRDAQSIILDMLQKSGGDVIKLAGMGLGTRGVKPLEGAATIYKDAGGGSKGLDAVKREFGKYTTGVSKEEIEAANKRVLAENKFEIALEALRIATGEQLLPEFVKMIPAMRALIPALVDAAKVGIPAFAGLMKSVAEFSTAHQGLIQNIAAHPIGTLMAAEIAKASLPTLLPALFTKAFAAIFGSPKPPTPGPGGGPSPVGVGLAAGVATAAVIYNAGTKYADGEMAADDMAAKVDAWGRGDHERGISPEKAAEEVSAAKGRLDKTGVFEQVGNIAASPFSDSSSKAYGTFKADQALIDSEKLREAIAHALVAGVRDGASKLPPTSSGSNGTGRHLPVNER